MKRVDRLWIKAINNSIDARLVDLLSKLKVIKSQLWVSYMSQSQIRSDAHRRAKEAKRSKSSWGDSNGYRVPNRPPRVIKPTKSR